MDVIDQTCIITSHFNFAGYKSNTENYFRWLEGLPKGFKVFTAEASLTGEFEVNPTHAFKVSEKYILWQKEALINATVRTLPEKYKYIIWCDHDVLFDNEHWAHITAMYLEQHFDTVQCFSTMQYLDREGKSERTAPSVSFEISKAHNKFHHRGGPGLVWGARRDFFEKIGGLDPYNIVGGGDRSYCEDVLGTKTDVYTKYAPPLLLQEMRTKRTLTRQSLSKNGAGLVYGNVRHLYHGKLSNRQYASRYDTCKKHKFDPMKDIQLDKFGLPYWTTDKHEMVKDIKNYFVNRKEDE